MAESDDLRQFMREIATRHERVIREHSRNVERIMGSIEAMGLRLEEQTGALRRVTDELQDTRDERRAHTAALWTLVDRLQNGGAQA